MTTNQLIILYKKYPYQNWQRIDQYILGDSLPSGDDPEDSNFYNFNLSFHDPYFIDPVDGIFKKLKMSNGDDICILTDTTFTQVLDDIKVGLIYENDVKLIAFDYELGEFINQYSVNVKQRDFSTNVFKINRLSFANNSVSQSLTTVLDYILSTENTRSDLGGILSNGQVIPKYLLLSENIDVQIFDYEGSTLNNLTEFLNSIDYKWSIKCYCCPDPINTIKIIQQVVIWQV